jgi:hypothetical protein
VSATPARYPYGPSRTFVYVVGIAIAAQVWFALPDSPAASDTADLERALYSEMQAERTVVDVRCARVSTAAANCVATLPGAIRLRVRARIDPSTHAITWKLVDPAPSASPQGLP